MLLFCHSEGVKRPKNLILYANRSVGSPSEILRLDPSPRLWFSLQNDMHAWYLSTPDPRFPNPALSKVSVINRHLSPHQDHLPHIPDPIDTEMNEIDPTGQVVGTKDTRMPPGVIITVR